MNNNRTHYWVGISLVLVSAFLFSLKGVFIKCMYQYGADTVSVLSLRMIFSAPFYLLVISWNFLNKKIVSPKTYDWRNIIFLSFMGYYLSSFMDFQGLNYITASLERVLLFVYPTFVLFINVFKLNKRITKLQWQVLALTYFGIVLVFLQNIDSEAQKNVFWGAFWVISAGFTYAIYIVGSDKQVQSLGSLNYACFSMILATIPTLIHCYWYNGFHIWDYPKQVYVISLAMALFSTVIPTFMVFEGIKRVGSANTSILNSIGPIFTIILATIYLGETISLLQFIGTIFVLLGVVLISWKGKNK